MTQLQKSSLSDIEKEIISLNVIIETIDSIINPTLFELLGKNSEKQVMFHDELHQKYFYIIAVDFLSKTDKTITGHQGTCIELIESICKNPNFNCLSS